MKRYKVSVDNGEYVDSAKAELPIGVRECIENLIESGSDCGTIWIPGYCCQFSVCPEQYFPADTIDDIHRICAELRSLAETIDGIDSIQFRQTIAVLRSSASRLTASAIRECQRNNELIECENDRIELKDESSGLCPYHEKNGSGYHHYLNPDCPVCEREIDRQNAEFDSDGGGIGSDDMFEE